MPEFEVLWSSFGSSTDGRGRKGSQEGLYLILYHRFPPQPCTKECVICGAVYVTEADWTGREHLIPAVPSAAQPSNSNTPAIPSEDQTRYEVLPRDITPAREPASSVPLVASPSDVYPRSENSPMRGSRPDQALEESSLALQSSLRMLSARLGTLSGSRAVTDPSSIGLTADAISKVTQALSHVRQLQWSESQTQRL